MKEPMVITMAREYASGGSEIAQAVADKLGIPLYNKELITLAAKKSGLTEEAIAASEKRRTGSPERAIQVASSSAVGLSKTISRSIYSTPCSSSHALAFLQVEHLGYSTNNTAMGFPFLEKTGVWKTAHRRPLTIAAVIVVNVEA